MGSRGLRAGWRVAIFALVVALVVTAAGFALSGVAHALHAASPKLGGTLVALLAELIFALAAFAATAVMARIEGRTAYWYGLLDAEALRRFAIGAACGCALMSVEMLLLRATGFATIAFSGAAFASALGFALFWGAVFLLTGFAEETVFRGYPLFALARGMGFWPAAILLSVVFGALHGVNGGEALVGEAGAGLIGLVLCFSLARTGSLWWAIGFHAAWDWTESYLWGARDSGTVSTGALFVSTPHGASAFSGGSVGPEGSVLVLIPIALAALAVVLTTRAAIPALAPPLAEAT
ncbi:MAG TPA: CPBP family intramembrane glutamic endopeptidase [Candidatus Baltobacteraceae bacterium]|nr:CPBP family intramembrane glutamic endopeptidase [Candidatus Baltobacteraceae bacterium]